ncbi:alpha-hydroxy acid oxidase [Bradyrhizobium sp. USDA 4529]
MKARSFKYILNVEDMRLEARRRLPRAIFDFVDGAAEDEVSRRRNRAQFDEWGFVQRVLNDVGAIDLSISLFGRRYAAPFGIGPTGLAGLAWPKAESLLARAAAAAGIPFCLSTVSSVRLEEVAETSGAGNWFQLYIFRNRDLSRSLLERARAAGYAVLVITVDCATGGNRERDPRNDFTLPLRLTRRNLADTALHPGWLMRMARTGAPKPAEHGRGRSRVRDERARPRRLHECAARSVGDLERCARVHRALERPGDRQGRAQRPRCGACR